MGHVAVVGPDEDRTGVLLVMPTGSDEERIFQMLRFGRAGIDLLEHMLSVPTENVAK